MPNTSLYVKSRSARNRLSSRLSNFRIANRWWYENFFIPGTRFLLYTTFKKIRNIIWKKNGFLIHKRIVINAMWLIFELYTNLRTLPRKRFDVTITSLIVLYKTVLLCIRHRKTDYLLSNETLWRLIWQQIVCNFRVHTTSLDTE